MEKCELHDENATLCESHIIPKFIYRWMKKTGTGRLRQRARLNTPLQDGIKKYMLCQDCEGKFSFYETWFSKNIFTPYLTDNSYTVTNRFELEYFITSVLWKIVKFFKDDGNDYKFKKELKEAELEWKNYLLNDAPLSKYKNQHFILINNDYWIDKKSDLYFSRAVDIEIVESNEICLIYAKFSRFILIGEVIGLNEDSFEKTNIRIESEFSSRNQMINESIIMDFFRSRIDSIVDFQDLSENQKVKNDKFYKNKLEDIDDKEYIKILRKYE